MDDRIFDHRDWCPRQYLANGFALHINCRCKEFDVYYEEPGYPIPVDIRKDGPFQTVVKELENAIYTLTSSSSGKSDN